MLKKINEDIKSAMKNKETKVRNILRMVLAKAKDLAKSDKNREVTSEDIKNAIQKQIKQNKETISYSKEDGRDCSKEEKEVEILMSYLPKQKTKEEMQELVRSIIDTLPEDKRNPKGRGIVMKELSKYKDVVDMKEAGNFAATLLN